ncbi:MAG: signal peptidase I [Candidatus Hydrogenedentes bacterium]|nr:signal peptidase I [Candidatus Hydrogenedentota bacterium]
MTTESDKMPVYDPQSGLKSLQHEARIFLRWVVAILLCVLVLRIVALDVRPVQGPSMEPNLEDGDRVLIWKLPYVLSKLPFLGGLRDFQHGDIVVFKDQEDSGKRYVKRVVAQGKPEPANGAVQASTNAPAGVSVLVDEGRVYIDNHLLEEPYVSQVHRAAPEHYESVLQPKQLYVMGDNRAVSKDSRRMGPIPASRIEGRVIFRIWPLKKWGAL